MAQSSKIVNCPGCQKLVATGGPCPHCAVMIAGSGHIAPPPRDPMSFLKTRGGQAWAAGVGVFAVFAIGFVSWVVSATADRNNRQAEIEHAYAPQLPLRQTAPRAPKVASVKISGVRIRERLNTETGRVYLECLVDWINTGNVPVTVVQANFTILDAAGQEIGYDDDYPIFVAYSPQAPIEPGRAYSEAAGQGHTLLSNEGIPSNARVEISTVSDRNVNKF